MARLPEGDQMLEAGDEAGKGCENEGVQRRDQPIMGCLMVGLGADRGGNAGDVLGQGSGF